MPTRRHRAAVPDRDARGAAVQRGWPCAEQQDTSGMLFRSLPRSGAAAAAVLLGACTSMRLRSDEVDYRCEVALPVDLTAAVFAGAVRAALPFADPLPNAVGAPASQVAGDCFEITFEQAAIGRWTPNATHRLSVQNRREQTPLPCVRIEALYGKHRLLPLGSAAVQRLRISVRGSAAGSEVRASLPPELAASLRQAFDRAAQLAVDPDAEALGLSEPNLAALTAHRLLRRATAELAAGEPAKAASLLQRAALLGADNARLHERLGELAARMGDDAFAREQLLQALLVTTDPVTRQHLACRVAAVESGATMRAPLQKAARERLAVLDTAGAEALLHTARRRWPQPAEDYRLQSELHPDGDMAKLACSLLAREHEAETANLAAWTRTLLPASLQHMVRRLPRGAEAAIATAPDFPLVSPGPAR